MKICVCVNMTSVADLPTHCVQLVSCCHVMSCDTDVMLDQAKTVDLHIDGKHYHFNYGEVQHRKL